jgi:tetratricopeptide (TPR) repeat protein
MSNNRLFLLNESKFLAMEGRYKEALEMVNQLILTISDDLDGLRLKGNILELEVYAENSEVSDDDRKAKLAIVQKCYERILELDSNNILALIDLGDYWQNQSHFDKSLDYYDKAIYLLKEKRFYLSLKDEFVEAFRGKKEVLQKMNKESELNICQKEEKAILFHLQRA